MEFNLQEETAEPGHEDDEGRWSDRQMDRQTDSQTERTNEPSQDRGPDWNLWSSESSADSRSPPLSGVSFNSVYTQIWRVLLHLAADPFPEVSDLAMKVLNSIAYKVGAGWSLRPCPSAAVCP